MPALRRARSIFSPMGISERTTITPMMGSRYLSTSGRGAERIPASTSPALQDRPADDLPEREHPDGHLQGVRQWVEHRPATGMKRSSTTALPCLCRASSSSARAGPYRRWRLRVRASRARPRAAPARSHTGPWRAHLRPWRTASRAARVWCSVAQHSCTTAPRGEQQRVAGREEADEQSHLGEQHDRDAPCAEGQQQRSGIQHVHGGQRVHNGGQRAGGLGHQATPSDGVDAVAGVDLRSRLPG